MAWSGFVGDRGAWTCWDCVEWYGLACVELRDRRGVEWYGHGCLRLHCSVCAECGYHCVV